MSEPRDLVVGTLTGGPTAVLRDPSVVEPVGAGWSVEWWIGAEDRWHRPLVESTTRQTSLPGAPIVETAVRVPGGDVTARTAGVMGPGATTWTVIEVTNRSAVPVALGWTIQGASSGLGPGVLHRIDGRRVVLGRSPRSIEVPSDLIAGTEDLGGAVAVQPLAHTSVAWLAIEGAEPATGNEAEELPTFPPLDRVVSGWAPFEEIGARLTIGDDGLQSAFRSAAAVVRLGGGIDLGTRDAALAARAGALVGAATVGERHLGALLAQRRRNGSVRADGTRGGSGGDDAATTVASLRAWCASVWSGDAAADELVLPIAAAATWLLKRSHPAGPDNDAIGVAVGEAIATLRANEQVDAGDALIRLLDKATRSSAPTSNGGTARRAPRDTGGSASAAARRAVTRAAMQCADGVDLLVGVDADGVELLAGWSPNWWGRAIEAHAVPTPWGALSFALRWHGDRPALLWEILDAPPTLVIHAPRLDAAWRGTGAVGEELLGAIERPVMASFS